MSVCLCRCKTPTSKGKKIAINGSKFTPIADFFGQFLVPQELPAKFQHSSMTCEPLPPSVHPYVPIKKIVFFCYWYFYQHWSRDPVSPVCGIFFSYTEFFVHLKIFFWNFSILRNELFSSFWKCENSKLFFKL